MLSCVRKSKATHNQKVNAEWKTREVFDLTYFIIQRPSANVLFVYSWVTNAVNRRILFYRCKDRCCKLECFSELKELEENPHFQAQKEKTASGFTDEMIDMPIRNLIKGFNKY